MLSGLPEVLALVEAAYEGKVAPRRFQLLRGGMQVAAGAGAASLAGSLGTTRKRLAEIASSTDPLRTALGVSLTESTVVEHFNKARLGLGQMFLGHVAERIFEEIYKATMGSADLTLDDERVNQTDTDYRVLNGERRPVFRCNIKLHGSLFREAPKLVGLEPENCFALATYKINAAIEKQNEEHLPFLFMVISVPGLTREHAGALMPEDVVHLMSLGQMSKLEGKRAFEDSLVDYMLDHPKEFGIQDEVEEIVETVRKAEWRVMSARRANNLLVRLLFQRVYAVRIRGFAKSYRNAEVDMHFSLSTDLKPLSEFLKLLRERGLHGVTSYLERGDF